MTAETILAALLRFNLVAGVAILLVLALRPLLHRWSGARVAYWLWVVVPICAIGSLLPAPTRVVAALPAEALVADDAIGTAPTPTAATQDTAARSVTTPLPSLPALADLLVAVWLLGAGALLARSVVSTRRLAADPSIGPALVGVLRPRLVLPADFEARFDAEQRALILAHEEIHRASGHTVVNALIEVARCAGWFNPLVHLAATRAREDQELACDAAVVASRPTARRAYAEALLKAQVTATFLPLGCTWTSASGKRLGERIAMLGRPPLRRRGAIAGATAVALVGAASGYVAWAQQPERLLTRTAARPEAVWTPAADAPVGALSHALEGQRHDFFIELAQKGDIDLVFFGTTTTEMWWWERRGKRAWDRELGSLKAANFGSQGTHPDSLVWRMENGELDGYRAKLFVLNVSGHPDQPLPAHSHFSDWAAGYAAIIAEIRARQPQAKILLLAAFPRGGMVPEWREKAAANAAALAELVDDQTVFYTDIGERFFHADGSFNNEMWGSPAMGAPGPAVGVGAQLPLYEVWAEELQPWLDRFVR
jgi:beta-lactamase regulating signal transducer with metallopeptidase domain